MAGFGDFMQAIQFGLGLAGGFATQAQKEREASEKSQLDLLKILKDDDNTLIPTDNEPNNAGFLGTLFGAPGGQDSYRIGGRSFRLQPKPKLSFDLGDDTSTAPAATAAPARGLGTYSPFGGATQAAPATQPQTETSGVQPQRTLSKTTVPADKQKVAQLVVQIAREQGIPEDKIKDVVAIAHHESGFRPDAEGRAGEIGVMQLMPSNVKLFNINDPYDPTQNITGGVKLYKTLLNKYGNDSDKATAAYNAGERPVDAGNIPRSTQAYVRNVRSTANNTYGQFANMVAGPGAPTPAQQSQSQPVAERTEITEHGADGQWYNLPLTSGGKSVTPGEVLQIARNNKYVNPDTGQPYASFATFDAARAATQPQQTDQGVTQPQAAPQAFLQTPVETEAQRVTAAKRSVLRQYQGLTDTEKNRLARTKDIVAAGEKAKADYRGEQSAVRADLTKLLENEHRPTVLKAAKEVLTYAQLAELTQKARDVPDVPWFTLVPQYMQRAIAQGQGDKAAADVYQEMTAANFKTDIIDRLLETSGYADIKKQRTAAAEARGRLGVEAEEGPKVIRAKAPAEADAAALKRGAEHEVDRKTRAAALKDAQELIKQGKYDEANDRLSEVYIPPEQRPSKLQEYNKVQQEKALGQVRTAEEVERQRQLTPGRVAEQVETQRQLAPGRVAEKVTEQEQLGPLRTEEAVDRETQLGPVRTQETVAREQQLGPVRTAESLLRDELTTAQHKKTRAAAQKDADALTAKGDYEGAAKAYEAAGIPLPPVLEGYKAEQSRAGSARAESRVFKAPPEVTIELDKLLAERIQSGELPPETTRDEFAQLFPGLTTVAQQNADKRKADYLETEKRIAANAPLHPNDVQKFMNPITGQRAPAVIQGQAPTPQQLAELQMIPLDAAAQRAVSERLTALDNLKTMRVLAFGGKDVRGVEHPGVFKVPDGFGSRASATVESYLAGLKQDTQHGIDLKALKALQDGLLSVYARGVAGERGNVATQDTARVSELFPTVTLGKLRLQSAEPLAQQLYNQLEDIITAPLNRIIGNGTIGTPGKEGEGVAGQPAKPQGYNTGDVDLDSYLNGKK